MTCFFLPVCHRFSVWETLSTPVQLLLIYCRKKYTQLEVKEADKSAAGSWCRDKDEYTKDFLATFRIYFLSCKSQ